ncbi:MAG: hypothetical protein WDN28_23755 [Chthoniobacter sp.]
MIWIGGGVVGFFLPFRSFSIPAFRIKATRRAWRSEGSITAEAMLPNGNIPSCPNSKVGHAGRHLTNKRYPPEQASGAGIRPPKRAVGGTKQSAVTLRTGLRLRNLVLLRTNNHARVL